MPIRSNIPRCTHIKLGGRRCGSPALSGEHYCYFHMEVKGATAARVDSAIPSIMLLEDADSIQGAIMQLINLVLQDQIPLAKARLILRAIEMASRNLKGMGVVEPAEEQCSEERGCQCEKSQREDSADVSNIEKPVGICAAAEEEHVSDEPCHSDRREESAVAGSNIASTNRFLTEERLGMTTVGEEFQALTSSRSSRTPARVVSSAPSRALRQSP